MQYKKNIIFIFGVILLLIILFNKKKYELFTSNLNKYKITKVKSNIFDSDYGLSDYLPDIDTERLTSPETGEIFGQKYGDPLSVNTQEILSAKRSIGLVDYKMEKAEQYYNSFSGRQDAMNKI